MLFYFTAIGENHEDKINDKPALQIGVVGFQWRGSSTTLEPRPVGHRPPRAAAELVLPVGEQIHFHLTSPDVIHSFWVVPFLFKRDVIPGHPNEFEVTDRPSRARSRAGARSTAASTTTGCCSRCRP